MTIRRLLLLSAIALAASTSATYAGPCSQAIVRMQAQINAKLAANAAAGPSGRQSTDARMHRQPTPRSIGAAESQLGEVSPQTVQAVRAAMTRAREADRANDKSACEAGLADAQREIGP